MNLPCNFSSEWFEEGDCSKPGRATCNVPFEDEIKVKKKRAKEMKKNLAKRQQSSLKEEESRERRGVKRPLYVVHSPYDRQYEETPGSSSAADASSSSSASITATASSSELPRGSVASPLFAAHPIYIYGLGLGCDDHDDEENDAEKDIDDRQGIMDNYDEDFGTSPQLTNPTAISISRVITFAQSKKNNARSRF